MHQAVSVFDPPISARRTSPIHGMAEQVQAQIGIARRNGVMPTIQYIYTTYQRYFQMVSSAHVDTGPVVHGTPESTAVEYSTFSIKNTHDKRASVPFPSQEFRAARRNTPPREQCTVCCQYLKTVWTTVWSVAGLTHGHQFVCLFE